MKLSVMDVYSRHGERWPLVPGNFPPMYEEVNERGCRQTLSGLRSYASL